MDAMSAEISINIYELQELIKPLLGKPNCRKQVGYRKSLSFGFGKKLPHSNPKLRDAYYGEWEIGTYNCAWRILEDERIICGSNDPADSVNEIDSVIQSIEFGCITSLQQPNSIDVRIVCENKLSIDFFSAISDEDEVFHIFCPQHQHIQLIPSKGWSKGSSKMT